MNNEQILLEKWRTLPSEKQQKVLEFVETLSEKKIDSHIQEKPASLEKTTFQPKTELGKKLWELRQKAIAAQTPLRTWEELEEEIAQRRGERSES